ncbi:hypothetical protein [Streptomyces sp. NPDC048269]|uniref:hypothetical protein n=1 Tax=Streptomyces sp. NPDC048269 TaxID=3155753 RepID=UPI00341E1690
MSSPVTGSPYRATTPGSAHGGGQCALQDDAAGLEHDQVLVAGARGRPYVEPVQLVPLAGPEPEHLLVDVGQFVPQDVARGAQQGVRLGRLRYGRPPPAEEIAIERRTRGSRVALEQFRRVPLPRREQGGGLPSDTSADDQYVCHCAPLSR